MHAILRRLGFGRHAARAGGTPTTFMASARRRGRAAIRESLRLESLECRRLLAVAMNDEFSVLEDRFGNQLPVLRNDQGDDLRIVEVGRPSAGGTVRIGDDGLVYSPRHDFHGAESFEYKVVDAEGDTDAARVVVHVENVNDPPTAENDRFRVEPDSEGNILRPLRNDTFRPDPEER